MTSFTFESWAANVVFLQSYPRFWPTQIGEEIPYGPLTIELESEEQDKSIVSRVFRIRKVCVSNDVIFFIQLLPLITTMWYNDCHDVWYICTFKEAVVSYMLPLGHTCQYYNKTSWVWCAVWLYHRVDGSRASLEPAGGSQHVVPPWSRKRWSTATLNKVILPYSMQDEDCFVFIFYCLMVLCHFKLRYMRKVICIYW